MTGSDADDSEEDREDGRRQISANRPVGLQDKMLYVLMRLCGWR
jgi:hypothetical protein